MLHAIHYTRVSKIQQARDELLEQIASGSRDGKKISQLVDTLVESGVPFKEAQLGGGPWVVGITACMDVWNL